MPPLKKEAGHMSVRRGPAIVLSLVLGAAALATPSAFAGDGGAAKDEVVKKDCRADSVVKLRITARDNGRLEAIATVWSDDTDVWSWRLRHQGDLSDEGLVKAKDADKSFKVSRTMIDVGGSNVPDSATFRAQNEQTGEVCKASATY